MGAEVGVPAEEVNGSKVMVGRGVCVNVAVGGSSVAVGIAAWVSAITVKAAAATVPCRSTAGAVGVVCEPHPLMTSVKIRVRMRMEGYFTLNSP